MDDDEIQIRQLVDTWMAATRAGDTETVLGLMADDVVFLVPGLEPFGKARFAEAAKSQSGASVHFEVNSEIEEIKVMGDCAFMRTRLEVSMSSDRQATVIRSGYTLSILARRAGKWLLLRDANLLK